MSRDPLYELYRFDDGTVGPRLRPWAAVTNLLLLSAFCWALIGAMAR